MIIKKNYCNSRRKCQGKSASCSHVTVSIENRLFQTTLAAQLFFYSFQPHLQMIDQNSTRPSGPHAASTLSLNISTFPRQPSVNGFFLC